MFDFVSSGFSIGNIHIQYYAIFIMIGVVLAVYLGIREGKKVGIIPDDIYLGVVIVLPIAIIGARLWYILFNLNQGWDFAKIIGFDENGKFIGLQGLAIQGGVISAIIAVFFYCRKRELSLYRIMDLVAPGFLVGQICGRWGNFFNHELFGPRIQGSGLRTFIYNLPLIGKNMCLTDKGYESTNILDTRHPTFLYESVLNLIGLIIMMVLKKKYKKLQTGDLIAMYLFWYGLVRIPTEILRSMSGANEVLMMGPIPVSIFVSCIFIACGIAFFILKRFFGPHELHQEVVESVKANKPECILFDLDGTLLNTKPLIDKSFIHTFAHFRPDYQLSDEELDSFFGPTLYQSFSRYSDDEKEIEEMIAYYREFNISNHDEMVKSFAGAKDVIALLHKGGYKLGVVSSKKTDLVEHGLDIFGLLKYMDVVIGADEVQNHKPAPDGILMAMSKLGVTDSTKVVYVGDTKSDMEAAKAANVKSCGVLYIKHPEIMLEVKPDMVINRLSDILRFAVV